MSLPHALLTALIERPSSGSDLAKRFDRSIGYFWRATHQQIYRELGRLENAGWVESSPAESTGGRKRNYRVLPAGHEELARWVGMPGEPQWLRDELMVRLRAEAVIGPTGLAGDIRHRLTLHERRLADYRAVEARDFSVAPSDRATALRHVVLTAGMRYETNWIETLRHALDVLDDPE